MARALGSASPKLRSAAAAASFASVYFVTAVIAGSLAGDAGAAVLWPASGMYLGVMLLAPHRMWPPLACAAGLGSLGAYLHGGSSFEVSLAFAVPSSAEGLLGALLVERIARKRFTFRGLHDLFALVLGGAVVANALVGLSAAGVAAQTFDASFVESWLRWWSADALGVIAVAPIITAPTHADLPRPARWWSRQRLAGIGALGSALVAMYLVSRGGDSGGQVYLVQAFLAVLMLSLLGFAATASERERLREALTRTKEGSEDELDRAHRQIAHLTADLAARRAELVQAGNGRDRVADDLRRSEGARAQAERELADSKSALGVAERELAELGRDLWLTVTDRDRVQSELDASADEVERLQREVEGAVDELARARTAGRTVQEELERTRTEGRALQDELERAQADSGVLEDELERLRAQGRAREEQLERAQADRGLLDDELERLRAEGRAREEQLERARAEGRGLHEEVERAHAEKEALAEELERACADGRGHREQLERAHSERGALAEKVERALTEGRALQEELERAQADRGVLEDELEHLRTEGRALQDELERAQADRGLLEDELERLRAEGRAREEQLERAVTERARVADDLADALSGRRSVEDELALATGRVATLESELERSRRAHADAELALEHARARFAERRENLERSLDEATKKLAHAQAERSQAADHAQEPSSRYDERGTCLSASPAFARLLGYEPDELVGHPGAELLHPDDRFRLARARASRSRTTFEARLRRKTGDFVRAEVRLDPVWSSDHRLVELKTTVRQLASQRAAA
jgi:PAS domain S-box-containing protein